MKTFLVTGASRGIGLALTERLLIDGHRVLAGARNPDGARHLWEFEAAYPKRLRIVHADVTDDNLATNLGEQLRGEQVDVLINNAGVMGTHTRGLAQLPVAELTALLNVNVAGVVRTTLAVLPFLNMTSTPVIAQISSKMGSIAENNDGFSYSYRMSKAAVNMFAKNLALEFPKIISVTMHPGWVKTQMGGPKASLEARDSAEGLVKVIGGLKLKDSGKFFDYKGDSIPW